MSTTSSKVPFENMEDRRFYRLAAIIAVVALLMIAAVIVVPRAIDGTAAARKATGEVIADVSSKAVDTAKGTGQVVDDVRKAVSAKGYSQVSDGANGVIAMFKSDPLYDGSPITVIPSDSHLDVSDAMGRKIVESGNVMIVLKYKGGLYYFDDVSDNVRTPEGKYRMVGFPVNLVLPSQSGTTIVMFRVDGEIDDSLPPLSDIAKRKAVYEEAMQ